MFQLGPDRCIWGNPHGLHRLVTTAATTTLATAEYRRLQQQARVLAGDAA